MSSSGVEAVRRAISVDEAAIQLGIGRSLAYELVREGRLRSVRAGNRILVPIVALEEFLARKESDSQEIDIQV